MNILLAFLLYKNLNFGDMVSLKPFLPVKTQRGLSALEAYNNSDCLHQCTDLAQLMQRLPNNGGFPYVLLRLLMMNGSSDSNIFDLIKQILPADIARNIPDPETIMNMMNIISAMNFSSDDDSEQDTEQRDISQNDETFRDTECGCQKHFDNADARCSSGDQDKKNERRGFDERQLSFFKKFIKDQ